MFAAPPAHAQPVGVSPVDGAKPAEVQTRAAELLSGYVSSPSAVSAWPAADRRVLEASLRSVAADTSKRVELRDRLLAGLAPESAAWSELNADEFELLERVGSSLGVEPGVHQGWLVHWIGASEAWRAASDRQVSAWLRRVNASKDGEPLRALRPLMLTEAVSRLDGDAAWSKDADRLTLLATAGPLVEAERRERWRVRLLTELSTDGQSPAWRGLPLVRLSTLDTAGRSLRVPEATRTGWYTTWLQVNRPWESGDARTIASFLKSTSAARLKSERPAIIALLAGPVLEQMAGDSVFLVACVHEDLLPALLPMFDDAQRKQLRLVLVAGLGRDDVVLSRLSVGGFSGLEQVAGQLRVPAEAIASWRSAWVTSGAVASGGASSGGATSGGGWRSADPYLLTLVLGQMLEDEHLADWRTARSLVLDHVLAKAKNDPRWLEAALWKGYARFVITLSASLQMDERYAGDRSAYGAAMVSVLNAAPVWPSYTFRGRPSPQHRAGVWEYRHVWYDPFHQASCSGSLSWGQGLRNDGSQELAAWMQRQLGDGTLAPRPATLYLLAWHHQGAGTLDGWAKHCDRQVTANAAGSAARLGWLMGRAYAAELSGIDPAGGASAIASGGGGSPIRGEPWLEQALSEAVDDTDRLHLVSLLALKRAVAGATDQATELVAAWRTRWSEDGSLLSRLNAVSPAIESVVNEVTTSRALPR